MAVDQLQEIAQARATMLMRGYAPLVCDIGRQYLAEMVRGQQVLTIPQALELWQDALAMRFNTRDDMEGFAVVPFAVLAVAEEEGNA